MSAMGQKQTVRKVQLMSALPPKADIGTQSVNVRFVPKADIQSYSIIWSARIWNDPGIVRPNALAVLRLSTNSNFVGCSTGISAGLAPCRILITKSALRRKE